MLVNAPATLLRTDLQQHGVHVREDDRGLIDALASLSRRRQDEAPRVERRAWSISRRRRRGRVRRAPRGGAREDGDPGEVARARPRGRRGSPSTGSRAVPRVSPGAPRRPEDVRRRWTWRRAASARTVARVDRSSPAPAPRRDAVPRVDATRSAEALAVLGDVSKPVTAGGRGGVAATPGPARASWDTSAPRTPWRGASTMRGVLGPSPGASDQSRVQSVRRVGRPRRRRPGGCSANFAGAGVPSPSPFEAAPRVEPRGERGYTRCTTPVSSSTAWLHAIVRARLRRARAKKPEPAEAHARFVARGRRGAVDGDRARARGQDVRGARSGCVSRHHQRSRRARRRGAQYVSLDKLVKRRQEEAVQVFAYFMELVFEGEHAAVASEPEGRSGDIGLSAAAGAGSPPPLAGCGPRPAGVAGHRGARGGTADPRPADLLPTRTTRRRNPSALLRSPRRLVRPERPRVLDGGCGGVVQDGDAQVSGDSAPARTRTPSTCPASSSRSCARTPPCRAR